jgi:NADPH2:quinone reductase
MKAVRYHECGGPEVLRWDDVPDPRPGPQEVLVKVEAAGVNFADLMRRSGRYHFKTDFPAMLGTEAAGTVLEVGREVRDFRPGDRVFCRTAAPGCQAELVAAPVSEFFRMPANVSFVDAAAIPVIFLTAYHMLKTLGPLRPGETVLVHAAASGVGTAAVQLAKTWGGRVLATASTEEKLALARGLGADETINYEKQDFVEEVMRLTGGAGVERVLECVGGDILVRSVGVLAPGGRLIIYGRASGVLPKLAPDEFFAKNLQVIGLNIGGKPWTQAMHRAALNECMDLLAAGRVRPVISAVLPMARVADAHRYLANRQTMGKVILTPRGEATQ